MRQYVDKYCSSLGGYWCNRVLHPELHLEHAGRAGELIIWYCYQYSVQLLLLFLAVAIGATLWCILGCIWWKPQEHQSRSCLELIWQQTNGIASDRHQNCLRHCLCNYFLVARVLSHYRYDQMVHKWFTGLAQD